MLLSYTAVRKHDSDKLEFVGLGYTDSSQYMCLFRSHQPVRLPLNPQRNDAATLQRIASAISGNSGNPLQPEPPRIAAAHATPRRQEGVRGETPFCVSPGGFPPISTRESGLPAAGQACLGESTHSTSRQIPMDQAAENPLLIEPPPAVRQLFSPVPG